MTPLYRAVEALLINQNPDGDKREISETAYNRVYVEVGDKKIMEESVVIVFNLPVSSLFAMMTKNLGLKQRNTRWWLRSRSQHQFRLHLRS